MLLIQVKLVENVFTPAQKSQIITKLTDAMVSIEGENMRPITLVVIEEVRRGDWAIGGQGVTTDAVHALAAGKIPQDIGGQALTTDAVHTLAAPAGWE